MNVFISHCLKDKELLYNFAIKLAQWGHNPIFAEDSLYSSTVSSKIEDLIDRSQACVLLYTKEASNSKFVNQEIGYIHKSRKPVFIIKEEEPELSGFVYEHDNLLIKDESSFDKLRTALENLEYAIKESKTDNKLAIVFIVVSFVLLLALLKSSKN